MLIFWVPNKASTHLIPSFCRFDALRGLNGPENASLSLLTQECIFLRDITQILVLLRSAVGRRYSFEICTFH